MKIEIHHVDPFGRQVFRKFHPKGDKILAFIPAEKGKKPREYRIFSQFISYLNSRFHEGCKTNSWFSTR
jgi:hypothetical protein